MEGDRLPKVSDEEKERNSKKYPFHWMRRQARKKKSTQSRFGVWRLQWICFPLRMAGFIKKVAAVRGKTFERQLAEYVLAGIKCDPICQPYLSLIDNTLKRSRVTYKSFDWRVLESELREQKKNMAKLAAEDPESSGKHLSEFFDSAIDIPEEPDIEGL